jgi:cob(I)alamin adenosyltransferase
MYNRRVPKSHPRVEAYGTVDELNAALGMARALARHDFIRDTLLETQHELVALMGELATQPTDMERYRKDGYALLTPAMTARLDGCVHAIEAQKVSFKGWATPGASPESGALEVARTVCRRAERRIAVLAESGDLPNTEMQVYLNRLSDALWLMARWVDSRTDAGTSGTGAARGRGLE